MIKEKLIAHQNLSSTKAYKRGYKFVFSFHIGNKKTISYVNLLFKNDNTYGATQCV